MFLQALKNMVVHAQESSRPITMKHCGRFLPSCSPSSSLAQGPQPPSAHPGASVLWYLLLHVCARCCVYMPDSVSVCCNNHVLSVQMHLHCLWIQQHLGSTSLVTH